MVHSLGATCLDGQECTHTDHASDSATDRNQRTTLHRVQPFVLQMAVTELHFQRPRCWTSRRSCLTRVLTDAVQGRSAAELPAGTFGGKPASREHIVFRPFPDHCGHHLDTGFTTAGSVSIASLFRLSGSVALHHCVPEHKLFLLFGSSRCHTNHTLPTRQFHILISCLTIDLQISKLNWQTE